MIDFNDAQHQHHSQMCLSTLFVVGEDSTQENESERGDGEEGLGKAEKNPV